MATKYATLNNTAWSAQVWKDAASGGNVVSAPGGSDVAVLNGCIVILDQSVTCQRIQGESSGGYFSVNSGVAVTVTGDVVNAGAGSYIGYNSGTLTIVGNVYSTGTGTRNGLYNYGTVTINGLVTCSNTGAMVTNVNGYGSLIVVNGGVAKSGTHSGEAINNAGAACTLVVNGNVYSTVSGSGYGIRGPSIVGLTTCSQTINGDVSGPNAITGGGGVWVINGDISSNIYSLCCDFLYAHSVVINGDVTALVGASGYMMHSSSYGTVTINGDVRNNATTLTGYALIQYGTVVINGDVYPPLTATDNSGTILIQQTPAGPLTVNGTVYGSDFGAGSTMANGFTLHYASNTARPTYPPRVKHAQSGALGMPICNGPWLMIDNTADTIRWKSPTGWRQFQDEASLESDYPDESDVRLGVDYQFGNLTGTCAVPAAGSVALGVPVDNTTGTAVLSAADIVAAVAGTGPYSVTVRAVDAAGDPVQGATIRLSRTGQARSDTSNAAGEVELGCVAATWTVAIEASGFLFTPTPLVVSGDMEQEYELTAISLETSEPGKVTGWAYVYDAHGALDPGQEISIKTVRSTVTSGMFAGGVRTTTANASGIAQFANLFPGNTYAVKFGTGEWINLEIPSTATSTYQIGRAIGPE